DATLQARPSWPAPGDAVRNQAGLYCQSGPGTVLIIQGIPNLSTQPPKPGDQKVSANGMVCLPPSDSSSNQRRACPRSSVCRVTSKPFLGLSTLGAHCTSMSAPISDWSP